MAELTSSKAMDWNLIVCVQRTLPAMTTLQRTQKLKSKAGMFMPEDIFDTDETTFLQDTPKQSHHIQGACVGRKLSKVMTVLATDLSRMEYLPLPVMNRPGSCDASRICPVDHHTNCKR